MDTTTIQVKVYHTCPEAWHLQCSVSVQFNSLPIMTLTAFCFCTIQQTSNHDTYSVLFLYNSTDFQSCHLQCSVSVQFNRLPIMTLTMFCFYPVQQTSNHVTYNVLFLFNSTDFQSWHLQCSVSIQFNRLPSTGHQANTAQPKADKCPSSASHFSLFNCYVPCGLIKGITPKCACCVLS